MTATIKTGTKRIICGTDFFDGASLAVDLVCIGSHRHSGLARALMGSVAQAVIAHSRSPVLLVRP